MTKKRVRELPLDDVIRHFIKAARRVDKDGGYCRIHMEFGAKPDQPASRAQGKKDD